MCKKFLLLLIISNIFLEINILASPIIQSDLSKINSTEPFQLNQNTGPRGANQSFPKVVFSSRFGYSFAWSDYRIGDHEALFFQPSVGSENILITDDLANSNSESSAFDISSDGIDFVFAWVSQKTRNLYIQKFNGNGEAISIAYQVTDSTNRKVFCPWSTFSPILKRTKQNNFYLLWEEACQGIRENIYLQKFTKDLVKIGKTIKINDTSDFAFSNGYSSISIDENENFAVSWFANFFENDSIKSTIYAQLFDNNCMPTTSKIKIDSAQNDLGYSKPCVAFLPNNNLIVVFTSAHNDNGNILSKLTAQLLSSTGNKMGKSFSINDDGNSSTFKLNPIVETSLDDKIIIGWVENRTANFDFDIILQLCDLNGNSIGSNIIANDSRAGRQENISIAVHPIKEFNEFVITWDDMRNGYDKDIYTQIFSTSGNFKDQNFLINDDEGSSNQFNPSIILADNGNFIVSWWDYQQEGNIFAQKFSNDGTLIGWNFEIITEQKIAKHTPAFCVTNNNEMIFTWNTGIFEMNDIVYQKFNMDGSEISAQANITNNLASVNTTDPSIGCDSAGDFFITWGAKVVDNPADIYNIYFKKKYANEIYNPQNLIVNDHESEARKTPQIAVSESGYFSIAWIDRDNQSSFSNIFIQPFSNLNSFEKIGKNVKVNDNVDNISIAYHSISIDSEGNSIVVWSDNRNEIYNIYAQRFTKEGLAIGENFNVSNSLQNTYSPSISIDEEGKFIIVWVTKVENNWAILGQRYLSNGDKFSESFIIAETTISSDNFNSVSPNVKLHNNKIYTTWSDTRSGKTGFDIWANIIEWDGVSKIQEDEKVNLIEDFKLYQNYPNPFNPSTTIKYTIPSIVKSDASISSATIVNDVSSVSQRISLRNVTLKIYNILGKEVATLVNEIQKPGTYELKFDAKNLSSGIYYYQLKFADHIETQKMILLK